MHALVIDDSGTTRRIIAGILREVGFHVSEAANGRAGLEHLRRADKPRLIVVDWNMPELDGLAMVKAVREQNRFDDVPIVMVTTEVTKEQIVKALTLGVTEYVMKPFTRDTFLEKLALVGIGDRRAP